MSRTVELPDDVYQRLEEEASAAGTTPAEWIAARLPDGCPGCAPVSRMLELPDATYQQLEEEASAAGATPAEWIATRLPRRRSCSDEPLVPGARTLADEMAGLIGLFSSDRGDLSERHSELFAEGLLEKRRNGTL